MISTIAGIVGKVEPLRYATTGSAVLQFSVAEKASKDITTWYRCTLFGKRAEELAKYITKGTRLSVTGKFKVSDTGEPSTWTDKDQKIRVNMDIDVLDLTLLGGGEKQPIEEELAF
ncbi:single-strand DNA-binding protein [Gammaproteobacteria bacterium]